MRIKVSAEVRKTESDRKVILAVKNIFPGAEPVLEGGMVTCTSDKREFLEKFRELIFSRRILDTVRSRLLHNLSGEKTYIRINKQAAFVGSLNIVKVEGESPLGAITVEVEAGSGNGDGTESGKLGEFGKSGDVQSFIDWLAPRTKDGRPVYGDDTG